MCTASDSCLGVICRMPLGLERGIETEIGAVNDTENRINAFGRKDFGDNPAAFNGLIFHWNLSENFGIFMMISPFLISYGPGRI